MRLFGRNRRRSESSDALERFPRPLDGTTGEDRPELDPLAPLHPPLQLKADLGL